MTRATTSPLSDPTMSALRQSSAWMHRARGIKDHCIRSGHPERLEIPYVQQLIADNVKNARAWNRIAINRRRELAR
ncbi:MAG: hypothetical protein WBA46_01800 [Thermomicrobiales bacterium]